MVVGAKLFGITYEPQNVVALGAWFFLFLSGVAFGWAAFLDLRRTVAGDEEVLTDGERLAVLAALFIGIILFAVTFIDDAAVATAAWLSIAAIIVGLTVKFTRSWTERVKQEDPNGGEARLIAMTGAICFAVGSAYQFVSLL